MGQWGWNRRTSGVAEAVWRRGWWVDGVRTLSGETELDGDDHVSIGEAFLVAGRQC